MAGDDRRGLPGRRKRLKKADLQEQGPGPNGLGPSWVSPPLIVFGCHQHSPTTTKRSDGPAATVSLLQRSHVWVPRGAVFGGVRRCVPKTALRSW